jgi:hypothetical protein
MWALHITAYGIYLVIYVDYVDVYVYVRAFVVNINAKVGRLGRCLRYEEIEYSHLFQLSCSETTLTGESRFHLSTPWGLNPGPS